MLTTNNEAKVFGRPFLHHLNSDRLIRPKGAYKSNAFALQIAGQLPDVRENRNFQCWQVDFQAAKRTIQTNNNNNTTTTISYVFYVK
jgi:hypothetical protein